MGLYDETVEKRRLALYAVTLVLFLAVVYLLLPENVAVTVRPSADRAPPGGAVILWVEVRNNGASPLSGVYVNADSPSGHLTVDFDGTELDVPPTSASIVSVPVRVSENSIPGGHLVRIFVSYPGRTYVVDYVVMVG